MLYSLGKRIPELRGDNKPIHIGTNSNIQDGAVLHTDPGAPLSVAANVTIGHQATLHGCTIGAGSLIGANTLITEGKIIPDNSLVAGSPGKVLRPLTEAEIAALQANSAHYVELMEHYSNGLHPIVK